MRDVVQVFEPKSLWKCAKLFTIYEFKCVCCAFILLKYDFDDNIQCTHGIITYVRFIRRTYDLLAHSSIQKLKELK